MVLDNPTIFPCPILVDCPGTLFLACSQHLIPTLVGPFSMLTHGPTLCNFCTEPLKYQGSLVQILAHLNTV